MKNFICSVIIPFKILSDNVLEFITNIAGQNNLSEIELIFVIGDCQANYSKINTQLKGLVKNDFILLQDNIRRSSPSRCWSIGLKVAQGEFVCFMATDTIIDENWLSILLSKLKSEKNAHFLVGNITESHSKGYLSEIEKEIDKRRFSSCIVDFRNFIANRDRLLDILNKYFNGKYFSDVELDFILKNQLRIIPTPVPELIIFNIYSETVLASAQRKFKHGVGYGRICKIFIDKFRRFRTHGLYEFILAVGILCKEVYYARLSYRNKIVLTILNIIFLIGMFLGIVLPASFAYKYYTFHFDE